MAEKQKFVTFRDLHKAKQPETGNQPLVPVTPSLPKEDLLPISVDHTDRKDQQISQEKIASLEMESGQARKIARQEEIASLETISNPEITASQETASRVEKPTSLAIIARLEKPALHKVQEPTSTQEIVSSQEIISWHSKPDMMASLPSNKGYTKIPNAIYDTLLPQLSAGEQIVFLHLYRLSWGFGVPVCNISLEGLARRAGYSSRQIQTLINQLIEKGLVAKENIVLGKGKTQGLILRIENISDQEITSRQEKISSQAITASQAMVSYNKDLKKKSNINPQNISNPQNIDIKKLADIIDQVRAQHRGQSLQISELSALVKEECGRQGITWDVVLFGELVR